MKVLNAIRDNAILVVVAMLGMSFPTLTAVLYSAAR